MYKLLTHETDKAKIKKEIEKFNKESAYCNHNLGNGSFGTVFENNVPSEIAVGSNYFGEIGVKENHKNREDNIDNLVEFKMKKYLIVNYVNSLLGEALIGNLVSNLFFDRITPHVVVYLGHSYCDDTQKILIENLKFGKNFTSFLNIPKYLYSNKMKINNELIEGFIIQILHTMYLLNKQFNLIHFDLSSRNIFVKVLEGEYFGTNMDEIDYFCYNLPKGQLYLKKPKFILKIGDFGASTLSYGSLIVKNNFTQYNEHNKKLDEFYPDYPNIKTFPPDCYQFLRGLAKTFGIKSPILMQILNKYMVDIVIDEEYNISDDIFNSTYFTKNSVKKVYNPEEILQSDIFSKYHEKPNGNILNIGFL